MPVRRLSLQVFSLKPFLQTSDAPREHLQAAHQRVIETLLEGVVSHAIRGAASDYVQFERDLLQIKRQVGSDSLDSSELLIAAGTAVKTLQEYNRRTGSALQEQSAEMQKITAMLTRAVVNLSVEGSTNVVRLQALEQQLERAAELSDVRALREKLAECLTGIREERIRQKAANDATVESLGASLRVVPPGVTSVDATTGLSTRSAAEAAIAGAVDGDETMWAAIFVIDHLHGLNSRFGHAVGDQAILLFAQHLAQNLGPRDAVFRWSGPAFLALLARPDAQQKIRRELVPLTSARLELNVEVRERTALLPVNFSWTLMPVPLKATASLVIDQFDSYVSSKVGTPANGN